MPEVRHGALDVLLARPLDSAMRVRALLCLGYACRKLGDRSLEERAFREAVRVNGMTTWDGLVAVSHLAETMLLTGRHQEALALADRVLWSGRAGEWLEGATVWQRGRIFEDMGEVASAR